MFANIKSAVAFTCILCAGTLIASTKSSTVYFGEAVGTESYEASGDCKVKITKENNEIINITVESEGYFWGLDTGEAVKVIEIDPLANAGGELEVKSFSAKSWDDNVLLKSTVGAANPESLQKLLNVYHKIRLKMSSPTTIDSLAAKTKIKLSPLLVVGRQEIHCANLTAQVEKGILPLLKGI